MTVPELVNGTSILLVAQGKNHSITPSPYLSRPSTQFVRKSCWLNPQNTTRIHHVSHYSTVLTCPVLCHYLGPTSNLLPVFLLQLYTQLPPHTTCSWKHQGTKTLWLHLMQVKVKPRPSPLPQGPTWSAPVSSLSSPALRLAPRSLCSSQTGLPFCYCNKPTSFQP